MSEFAVLVPEVVPVVITSETLKANAAIAAARGAEFMDRFYPGWAEKVQTPIDPTRSPVPSLLNFNRDTVDGPATAEEIAAIEALMARNGRENVVGFVPRLSLDNPVLLFSAMLGIPAFPHQDLSPNRDSEIDAGYYGFTPEPAILAFGRNSSSDLADGDDQTKGWCIEKAGWFLAEAWDAEVAKRKGAK